MPPRPRPQPRPQPPPLRPRRSRRRLPGRRRWKPIDQAILDTLAAATDKPPDNGSGLLVGAGVVLGLFVLAVAGWAFYHRSSRYMPA